MASVLCVCVRGAFLACFSNLLGGVALLNSQSELIKDLVRPTCQRRKAPALIKEV